MTERQVKEGKEKLLMEKSSQGIRKWLQNTNRKKKEMNEM